jgi:hypothetical protein
LFTVRSIDQSPKFKAIDLKGSGNIQVLNLNEDKFTASISGSGNMDLDSG